MKGMFTLSAALMMAASVSVSAQGLSNNFKRVTPEQAKEMRAAKKSVVAKKAPARKSLTTKSLNTQNFEVRSYSAAPMLRPAEADVKEVRSLRGEEVKALDMTAQDMERKRPAKAPASITTGAFYELGDGMYRMGMVPFEDEEGFSYGSYYTPYLVGPAYHCSYQGVAGDKWTIGEQDSDLSAYVTGGNECFFYDMGIGGYYTPKIWNGGDSYYYGSEGSKASENYTYSVAFLGQGDTVNVGMYDMYDCQRYTGYSNTFAFGSRDYTNAQGQHVTSDAMVIDFSKPAGGSFVVDAVEFPALTTAENPFLSDDAFIGVTIMTFNEQGDTIYHEGIATAEDATFIVNTGSYNMYQIKASFFEEDEDGFQASYSPVLNDKFEVYLYNLSAAQNVNVGIFMTYDENAPASGSDYGTHSYYNRIVDGVEEEGFYASDGVDAIVNLECHYTTLCEIGTGEKYLSAGIPAEGGMAITAVGEDGTEYSDFDIEFSGTLDELEVYDLPDWLAIDGTDQWYDEYGFYAIFVGTKNETDALPAGVEGRSADIILCKGDEAYMTLHIYQGKDVQSETAIATIKLDGKKANKGIYNVQGVRMNTTDVKNLPAGLYLVNGKKQLVK